MEKKETLMMKLRKKLMRLISNLVHSEKEYWPLQDWSLIQRFIVNRTLSIHLIVKPGRLGRMFKKETQISKVGSQCGI
jgi:hypothetical protein